MTAGPAPNTEPGTPGPAVESVDPERPLADAARDSTALRRSRRPFGHRVPGAGGDRRGADGDHAGRSPPALGAAVRRLVVPMDRRSSDGVADPGGRGLRRRRVDLGDRSGAPRRRGGARVPATMDPARGVRHGDPRVRALHRTAEVDRRPAPSTASADRDQRPVVPVRSRDRRRGHRLRHRGGLPAAGSTPARVDRGRQLRGCVDGLVAHLPGRPLGHRHDRGHLHRGRRRPLVRGGVRVDPDRRRRAPPLALGA